MPPWPEDVEPRVTTAPQRVRKRSSRQLSPRSEQGIAVAFLGTVVGQEMATLYEAYSAAGDRWQKHLLRELEANGLSGIEVFSGRPVTSFPVGRRIFYGFSAQRLVQSIPVRYPPFINCGPLKTLTLGLSTVFCVLLWGWRHRRYARRLVLCYNVSSPHGLCTLLAAWLTRSTAAAVVADVFVPGDGVLPNSVVRQCDYALQRYSLRFFDGLVVLTDAISEDFAPKVKAIKVEGGVDEARAPVTKSNRHTQSERTFTFMYAGGLSPFNGVQLLLDGFALLNGEQYRLVVAGSGPEEATVRAAVAGDARIEYLGVLNHERLYAQYELADALINPRPSGRRSNRYVFPSKLLEYLATGKPVVTTATVEIAKEYGAYVVTIEDETPEGLARTLSEVACRESTDLQELGEAARRFVLGEKTWRAQGRRIASFLQRVSSESH